MYNYITVLRLIHFQQHNSFKEFANKKWRHLKKMEEIFLEGGANGTYVFRGGTVSTQPAMAQEDHTMNEAITLENAPSLNLSAAVS